MRQRTRSWLVAFVVGGMLAAVPGVAAAADAATEDTSIAETAEVDDRADFHKAKHRALHAIDKRLHTIARLTHRVETSRTVTELHAAKLLHDLRDAREGLVELGRKIKAAQTAEELRELVGMIGDFKIYQVVRPKVNQVLASDRIAAATEKLTKYSVTLEELIERAANAGYDVERPKYLLAKMRRNIVAAYELGAPVADKVVDLQPEDWPEPAKELLQEGRRRIKGAVEHLQVARKKGRQIVHWLRNLTDPPIDLAELD